MKLPRLFDFASEADLSAFLVKGLVKQINPEIMAQRRQVLSAARITRVLEQTFRTARESQKQHQRNWIQRAVLLNKFRWGLNDAGYPKEFVEIATEGLMVEISNLGTPSKPSGT
ncbi:MAG: hypothetical protein QM740_05315 [Acidovorax sp.]